jgi:hypothetical protein
LVNLSPADFETLLVNAEVGTPESIALTRRLMRHVVGIYFDFRLKQERFQFVHTAFLFSVEGRRLLMTAGHCVTQIDRIRANGGVLTTCLLIDSMGEGAAYYQPIPFAYDDAHPMPMGITEDIDYGVLLPTENSCQLLSANGIVPLDEQAWDTEPSEVRNYFLLGFPEQLNAYRGNLVTVRASMFRLERYAERPEDFPEADPAIYFYGRIIENPLNNVRGCSGGPILALTPPNSEGTALYHLVALQSTAIGRDIKGMLMPPLGELLRDLLSGQLESNA